jgi:hypothetical protein
MSALLLYYSTTLLLYYYYFTTGITDFATTLLPYYFTTSLQDESNQLSINFPEEYEVISTNLLKSMDLDNEGQLLKGVSENDDAGDKDKMETRQRIMISLKLRAEQRFVSMCHAAGEGDVDGVLHLARQGVDIDQPNHDGRTILHMAAAQGNYKMVEVLLQQGANRDAVDRWGSTPLYEV